jgi:pSer/pThr/pTyr-binding forkhead associated (FHA) protein
MLTSLPFEWFILLLRILFIFLLYFFLFQVVRVILRELQTFAHAEPSQTPSKPGGHLIVNQPGGSGLRAGERLELEPVTVIGRHPRATIVLDDAFVSSEHAQLSWTDGRWWVTDLDSTNGTLLNGREVVVPTGLRYGDQIGIGEIQLQLTR